MMVKKIILKKNKGNVTSLVIGQLFMLVLLIWCLFNYRLKMLNTAFNYIDDALTSSTLGAAIVNTQEFGKSHQILIHNSDVYVDNSSDAWTGSKNIDYNGWEEFEAKILLSELNYKSDIVMQPSDLDKKTQVDIKNRDNSTFNIGNINSTDWSTDKYLRKSVSAFIGNLVYNTSNGNVNSQNVNTNLILDNVSAGGSLNSSVDLMKLTDKVLNTSFLGDYIIDDVVVTKLNIYNIYRAPLAQRHVYTSEYMVYDGKKDEDCTLDEIRNATNIVWDSSEPNTVADFELKYMPKEYISGVENPDYYIEYASYLKKLAVFKKDLAYYNKDRANYPLICYTNTGTTFQGNYDASKTQFDYFYSKKDASNNIQFNNLLSTSNAAKITEYTDKDGNCVAPITGYSVYSYTQSDNGTNPSTTFEYTPCNISGSKDDMSEHNSIKIQGGKLDGTKVTTTSIYVELTFTLKTFPTMLKDDTTYQSYINTKKVKVNRLIDIDLSK